MTPEEQLKSIYNPEARLSDNAEIVKGILVPQDLTGYDFNQPFDFHEMMESYKGIGFQARLLHEAIEEINKMIKWRNPDISPEFYNSDPDARCTIFLGYTSNMVSCGLRDIIRYLVQHKMISCIVTSAGGIEEDIMKCLGNFEIGKFDTDDKELRKAGQHRIGNIYVNSANYCRLQDWLYPIWEEMMKEQEEKQRIWSPRHFIQRLGEKINNQESILYWASKHDIPVFCPALTDGALGDMLYYFSQKKNGFIIDLIQDIREINSLAMWAKKSGVIILGGGMVKHHILNANIWRNGADYGVFINTGIHYDGSDSGAKPEEAITWGKLCMESSFVKVWAEATLLFPIVVASTFRRYQTEACRVNDKEMNDQKEAHSNTIMTKKEDNEIHEKII